MSARLHVGRSAALSGRTGPNERASLADGDVPLRSAGVLARRMDGTQTAEPLGSWALNPEVSGAALKEAHVSQAVGRPKPQGPWIGRGWS